MKKINVSHVNNEHSLWLRSLNFYKTEIGILKGILTEIAGKYTSTDILKEVEHFENQFKLQINNVDILSHDIHVNLQSIAAQASQANAGYIDGQLVADHTALGERFEAEEMVMKDLVRSFRKFAEQWM